MFIDNVVFLLVAGIFSVLALILSFYIGVEVVRLLREFAAGFRESARMAKEIKSSGKEQVRPITPYRDRGTVERLIDHFEEEGGEQAVETD